MIKKLCIEDDHNKIYNNLSYDKQEKYKELLNQIYLENEEYIIGIDLAKEDSKDFSVLCKFKEDKNGKFILDKIIKMF